VPTEMDATPEDNPWTSIGTALLLVDPILS
jgi:hypothetical protein